MKENESINATGIELLFISDSIEDIVKHIEALSIKNFGLVKKVFKPKWWFGE